MWLAKRDGSKNVDNPDSMTKPYEELSELISALEAFTESISQVETCGQLLIRALKDGCKILTAGNGGSASDAMHLSEELVGRFLSHRRSLPAICLASDAALLTCIGNDFGFETLFARQVEGLGRTGDVLVVFSTSGGSDNLILALQKAKSLGVSTIALLGKRGGRTKGLADHEIIVPSQTTSRIQEIHTLILHLWMTMVEKEFAA
jgi:D-sedoheptulose 7-phosphate isomerase